MDTELTEEQIRAFVLAAHGDLATVKAMHGEQPALLNVRYTQFNETPLEAAGHMGNRPIAEYLLAAGAPLTVFAAAMLGQEEDVRAFLQQEPGLARTPGVHGISLLYHAALSGRPEVAALVVADGGTGQDAALHAAVQSGQPPMVAWLLAHGVEDANAPDFKGKTPLRRALDKDQTEIAALLRAHGGHE